MEHMQDMEHTDVYCISIHPNVPYPFEMVFYIDVGGHPNSFSWGDIFFFRAASAGKKNTSTKSVIINRSTLWWVHYRRWILSIILTTWAGNLSFCGIAIFCDRIKLLVLLKGLQLSVLPLRCTLKDQNHMGQQTFGAIRNGLTKSDEMSWTLGVSP